MYRFLVNFDAHFIHFLKKISVPLTRISIFIVFFWFGLLKLIGSSPANIMVMDLMEKTLPFMTWHFFIIAFSIYEIVIGISFLIPRFERFAIALLLPHMFMTLLPLIFLTDMTWQGFLTPTLEGQYIIKNLVIIAAAVGIAAHLYPIQSLKKRG